VSAERITRSLAGSDSGGCSVEQATGGRKIVGEQVNCCDYRKGHRRGRSGLICDQATSLEAGTEERADTEKLTALIEVERRLSAEL
jgi:hypothetical protein